jgi:two-component system response regulator CpxR
MGSAVVANVEAPMTAINVLVVDDDREFARLLAEFLSVEGGFCVTTCHDGAAGAAAAVEDRFDVIVLDVGLPKLNGFEVLKRIRQKVNTPVVMLTARGDDIDRILGLEIGADDYVPKPCNLRELVARIRAILRRLNRQHEGEAAADRLVIGDLKIEPGAQSVYRGGELVPLTGAEYLVLEALAQAPGQVVDKDSIARHALGRRIMPLDRSVDAHVSNLRKKLGPLADGRQRIKTVRGRGYLYVIAS